jgi:nucleotide-binding universal stress UspA family protein
MFPTEILLATDGSADAALAARAAVDLSVRTGSELHLAHVWHTVPSTRFESYIRSELHREAEELLAEQTVRVREAGGTVAQAHLREGPPVDEILDLAGEIGAGLVVVGSRGLGPLKRLALGSVCEGVVHHARCPVLILRGGERAWPPRRILVGDDGSGAAKAAGELASGIGAALGAEMLLVRAHPPFRQEPSRRGRRLQIEDFYDALFQEEKILRRRAGELEGLLGGQPEVKVVEGDPVSAILKETRRAGRATLVAVGSRGLGPMKRLRLGSVSTKIVRVAKGPVLVCPNPQRRDEDRT